jgi:RimJ/RimL family protein N-acetyltransferase
VTPVAGHTGLEVSRIEGARVALRPFRAEELDRWVGSRRASSEAEQPGGPPDRKALRERVRHSGHMREGALDLAIESDGRLIGEVQSYRPPHRPLPPNVFEIGIALFEPEDRRKGLGREAVALITSWLFQTAGAGRVQAATREANAPMRRVLELLGFVHVDQVRDQGVEYLLYAIDHAVWLLSSPPT